VKKIELEFYCTYDGECKWDRECINFGDGGICKFLKVEAKPIDEKVSGSGRARCSICGVEKPIYDLFDLTACRGASSLSLEAGCVLVCEECMKRIYECLKSLEEFKEGDDE